MEIPKLDVTESESTLRPEIVTTDGSAQYVFHRRDPSGYPEIDYKIDHKILQNRPKQSKMVSTLRAGYLPQNQTP